MELHRYREQIEGLRHYKGIKEIPSDPYDIEAALAKRLDDLAIPDTFVYQGLPGVSYESQEKLERVRPSTVGQASRIPGVRPSDVALLIGHLRGQLQTKAS